MPDVPPAVSDPHNAPPPQDAPQIKEITQERQAALLQAPLSTPPPTGGGYSLTPAQIESAISQCNTLANALSGEALKIHIIEQVSPLAPDSAGSVLQCDALRRFAGNLELQNTQHVIYVNKYLEELTRVKHNYMTAERLNEDQWNRLAGGSAK